ncbi:hypothetical protein IAU60_000970 [Kwoniella sp. DSM 27419]
MADLVKNGEPSSRPSLAGGVKEGSIPLYLVDGIATVWDAQVAATLHCVHNVSGLRAGTLPGVSQQNGFLGLPVTLTKEEAAYLVQEGIAHLIPLPSFPLIPSAADIATHTQARKARVERLESLAREQEESRKAQSAKEFEKGGEKARAKREARARAKAEKAAAAALAGEGLGTGGVMTPAGDDLFGGGPAEMAEQGHTSSQAGGTPVGTHAARKGNPPSGEVAFGHFHTVPSQPSHPDITLSRDAITSLPHPCYPFPRTPRDRALVGVFTALQDRGYRMGLGPRFGGEYLIYPGDYLRYHAHFTSQILVRDQPIRPAEIVAWGRLGTGTKKAGLICCWDDGLRTDTDLDDGEFDGEREKEAEVEFYSLEWANFG